MSAESTRGEPPIKRGRWPVNKLGHSYNPDRTKWKEAMKLRRERTAKQPKPDFAFVCGGMDFSSWNI